MKNDKNSEEAFIERLKEYIENVAGFKMCTPKNFENLAQGIFNETGSLLSSTTLKRLWGYLHEKEQQTPRLSTLNILSRYIGYIDYETFCKYQMVDEECESDFLNNRFIKADSLSKGQKVKLMWQPDRVITIQYIGLSMFKVLEIKNSKLSPNDIFICNQIVENQPLLLSNLIHENGDPLNYICGKMGGVKFQVLDK